MQPSSRLRACMEIADRVQIGFARSRRLDIHWFSRPRLLTVAPYLSTDLPCLPDASGRGDHAVDGAREEPPWAIKAQTIRAILFARATVISMRGLRDSMPANHAPAL